ncbi:uncharacterized protein LOC130663711 isoform X2 [Microplitis mediator]|uniref:uncharacterized protein LOC130663711 isoform X2 n=1 Tax=Microplitis mediator TaxID=375433 RepID=UPI0025532CFD|nr:uncharacterized protein LOC130663711 isoform X2 [Microplitis mediator]
MEYKRIQKLLLTEYEDFTDKVLVESPFAQTTRDGDGLRQVALGLTSSKFIIASDIMRVNSEFICPPELDSSIESFELVSIYPLNYITLSIYRRRRRKTLKARFIDGHINYYELSGMDKKKVYWNLWCKQVRILLSHKENASSLSEPTAASSTSVSTLYVSSSSSSSLSSSSSSAHSPLDNRILRLGMDIKNNACQVWTHYGGAGDGHSPQWHKKDLYLGPSYNELSYGYYTPIMNKITETNFRNELNSSRDLILKTSNNSWPTKTKHKNSNKLIKSLHYNDLSSKRKVRMKRKDTDKIAKKLSRESSNNSSKTLVSKLSRFKFGIDEKCIANLHLEPHYGNPHHMVRVKPAYTLMNPYKLMESGVIIWEKNSYEKKKLRRWGLVPTAHFLYALGPWPVTPGDRISLQRKRSSSAVAIRRHGNLGVDLKLNVSKKQLVSSVSLSSLTTGFSPVKITNNNNNNNNKHFILFWTPDYWYRPRSAISSYRELHKHLNNLRDYQSTKKKSSKIFFLRKNSISNSFDQIKTCDKTNCIINKIFSMKDIKNTSNFYNNHDNSINQLRKLLKLNLKITAWDLNSTTIAQQLTLIDRDLFLRISLTEMEILIIKKLSKNTPNVRGWIAFSHRISCLVTSEILSIQKLNMRARILTRFINAAYKCYFMGNFQSCRSILAGLQSPPIYRLKNTWSRLKTHHSTAYDIMSKLSKIFKNVKAKIYERAWSKAEHSPQFMPYIGDILVRVLKINNYESLDSCNHDDDLNETNIKIKSNKIINWDGGSTFITEKPQALNTNINLKYLEPFVISKDKIKSEKKNIVNKILNSFIKTKNLSCVEEKKDEFFILVRQLLLARRYFNRWQTAVITAKIIAQDQQKRNLRFAHKKNINKLLIWFEDCQKHAQNYDYSGHSFAWEFLLKARYREDRENFSISKILEPSLDK